MERLVEECHQTLKVMRIDIIHELSDRTNYYSYSFKYDYDINKYNINYEDYYRQKFQELYPEYKVQVYFVYPVFPTVYNRYKRSINDDKETEMLLYQLDNNYYFQQALTILSDHPSYSEAQNIISIIKRNYNDVLKGYCPNLININNELRTIYNKIKKTEEEFIQV